MHDQGIAWMIAGGVRAESAEDQRQRMHRLDVINDQRTSGTIQRLRDRIDAVVGSRAAGRTASASLSADCCPA